MKARQTRVRCKCLPSSLRQLPFISAGTPCPSSPPPNEHMVWCCTICEFPRTPLKQMVVNSKTKNFFAMVTECYCIWPRGKQNTPHVALPVKAMVEAAQDDGPDTTATTMMNMRICTTDIAPGTEQITAENAPHWGAYSIWLVQDKPPVSCWQTKQDFLWDEASAILAQTIVSPFLLLPRAEKYDHKNWMLQWGPSLWSGVHNSTKSELQGNHSVLPFPTVILEIFASYLLQSTSIKNLKNQVHPATFSGGIRIYEI